MVIVNILQKYPFQVRNVKNINDFQVYVAVEAIITMNGKDTKVSTEGTVAEALLSMDVRPNTFLFLIDGTPIPSDTPLKDGMKIHAIRVASGG